MKLELKMKAIVLGMGLQGKAVIHDLERSDLISKIFAANINLNNAQAYLEQRGYTKTEVLKLDASQDGKRSKQPTIWSTTATCRRGFSP